MTHSQAIRLFENVAAIRKRIDAAAERSGRPGSEISLIAVTKYVSAELTAAVIAAGCRDVGESRPQDLWKKVDEIPDSSVRWHLIGHLQRNKVRRTLPLLSLIHSADSLRLLSEIDGTAAELGSTAAVLLEVNVSGDATKHGFKPSEMPGIYPDVLRFNHLDVQGMMTMASREGDLARARDEFRALRILRDQLRQQTNDEHSLNELSMGMSGDFDVAIEEGSTMVRVGSALFEGLET